MCSRSQTQAPPTSTEASTLEHIQHREERTERRTISQVQQASRSGEHLGRQLRTSSTSWTGAHMSRASRGPRTGILKREVLHVHIAGTPIRSTRMDGVFDSRSDVRPVICASPLRVRECRMSCEAPCRHETTEGKTDEGGQAVWSGRK